MKEKQKTTIDASDILSTTELLRAKRSSFESIWRESANSIFPRMNMFGNSSSDSNSRKKSKTVVFSKPMLALTRFAIGYNTMLTPPNGKWHDLSLTDKKLEKLDGVSDWLLEGRATLFRERYSGNSGFAGQIFEKYMSLGLFGNGILAIDPNPNGGIIYKTHHINEHLFTENANGRIDVDYHEFKLTGRQALEKYGDKLGDKTFNLAQKKPMEKFDFIHLVKPNPDFDPKSILSEKKKFISIHVDVASQEKILVTGFNTFPYSISRYVTIPNDVYGTGPAQLVLPDILMANEMSRTGLVSKKLRGLPPVLVKNDGIISPTGDGKITAGKVLKGGLDSSGNPNMRPYISGADPVVIDNEISRSEEIIDEAFLVNIFRILTETKRMTATEVLERLDEKSGLLAPLMGKEQTESLSVQIEREIDILSEQGRYPALPEALLDIPDASFDIVYTSPLSQSQKAKEALGIVRTVQTAMEFAQADPSVLKRIDFDKAIQIINDSNVGNSLIMRSDEEVQALTEQEALQQAAAFAAQAQGQNNA